MMTMHLSQAAQVTKASYRGSDVVFRGISTDTRTLVEGNLFVALQGPNFDGHDYLAQARERGAVAAAVTRADGDGFPLLQVGDTRLALGQLAAYWRSCFAIPFVAVTGSNGKTSVKEMIGAILSCCGETLVTRGNLNNDIGVPLTLNRLSADHRYAVIELGANHPGEIAYLRRLVKPRVAVVNNAGPAHLEGFGDLPGVARAKGELFAGLDEDAVCIINADDTFASLWRSMAAPHRVISFGLEQAADVRAEWCGDISGSDIELVTPVGTAKLHLAMPGRHNVMNALAATAAALALDIALPTIKQGLESIQPVHGRWQRQRGLNGSLIIDDTYNANPASLRAALQLLSGADAETWVVLGDMGELGAEGIQLHRDAGAEAREAGVKRLFALGELAGCAAEVFGDGGEVFEDANALIDRVRQLARKDVVILVKGSRAMRLERVVEAMREAE